MQKNLYNKKHNRAPLRHLLAVFHLAPPTEDRAELVRWALSYVAFPRLLHFSYYFRPGSNGVRGGYPESGGGQKSILGYQVLADLATPSVWARFILLFSLPSFFCNIFGATEWCLTDVSPSFWSEQPSFFLDGHISLNTGLLGQIPLPESALLLGMSFRICVVLTMLSNRPKYLTCWVFLIYSVCICIKSTMIYRAAFEQIK